MGSVLPLNMDTLAALDAATSVTKGATVNGTGKDIGNDTIPQQMLIAAQFAITNAGTTDGYDVDVTVQFSDDNTTWPDSVGSSKATTQGLSLCNMYSATAAADLALSAIYTFVPELRYFRFVFKNNNGTDAVSVTSEVALHRQRYSER